MAQKKLAYYKRLGKERPGGGHALYPTLIGTARSAPAPGLLSCLFPSQLLSPW